MRNITEIFLAAAENYSAKTAIIDKSGIISFKELEKQVKRTASLFTEKGIEKGDRILVFVPMSIDLYRVLLSIFYVGAVAVFIDEWADKDRLEKCCKIADCKAFIGGFKAKVFAIISKPLRKIPVKIGTNEISKNNLTELCNIAYDDSALITFTTGSTGIPKAANRTHGFLFEQYKAIIDKMKPESTDVDMPTLPIVLLINLGVGATSVIADFKPQKPEKLKPELITNQINQNKVSRISASPFFVTKLANHIISNKIEINSISRIITGGAPVFPDDAELLQKAFPKAEIEIWYGSTEAEPISSINTNDLVNIGLENGLPVGKIYSGAKVEIIPITNSPIDDLQTLKPHEIGEIAVSGHHVLKNYYNNPDAFKENKIVDGEKIWHRTGDAGYKDINGNLYLTGRAKNMIFQNKKWISPFILEYKLKLLLKNNANAVLLINKEITAFIELETVSKKLEIIANIKQSLPIIKNVIVLKSLPRDPRHFTKIDYEKLRLSLEKSRVKLVKNPG